jgi:hypothetical protein
VKWTLVFTVLALGWNNPLPADDFNLCKNTVTHIPRAGVVYGDDNQIIPDPIEIPITIDIADRYNIDVPQGANFDTNFGTISIYKNGDVFYNGRDISGTIKDVCENERTETAKPTGEEDKNSSEPNTGGKLP